MSSEPKLVWTDVDSSNVRSVAYHEPSKTLVVKFHNGGLYTYDTVDMETYTDLVHAPSVGQYLARSIKSYHGHDRWNSEDEVLTELAARKY